MFTLMVSLWESMQKFVLYWQVYLIKRPPQPRHVFIWDMEIVLQYIRTNWYDNSSLNDADLTCKLTALLVLTIASRASMIQHLITEFMAKDRSYTYFISASVTKFGGKFRLPQLLSILLLVRIRHYV